MHVPVQEPIVGALTYTASLSEALSQPVLLVPPPEKVGEPFCTTHLSSNGAKGVLLLRMGCHLGLLLLLPVDRLHGWLLLHLRGGEKMRAWNKPHSHKRKHTGEGLHTI